MTMDQAWFGRSSSALLAEGETDLRLAVAAGDRAALDALVERTYPVVFRVLCQLCHGNAVRAADLTQETYRRAWASLERFESRSSFSTWLVRIAYNAFIDETRRVREVASDPELEERAVADPAIGPADALIRDETARALRRAVLGLSEELRFTVVARFWADAPVADIAALLGLSEVAIRKRLKRAFALIADALGETAP